MGPLSYENALIEEKPDHNNGLVYLHRGKDGWSTGNTGKIHLVTNQDADYVLKYFTSSPEKHEFIVVVMLDNKRLSRKKIISGRVYDLTIFLAKGLHDISVSINHTFNPKELNMSQDDRNLGVHFELKKVVDKG